MNEVIKNYVRQVHKFGGSSLATVKCYQGVAKIIKKYSKPGDLIVVSAAGKTTEQLIYWLKLKKKKSILAYEVQEKIFHYQKKLIFGLLSLKEANKLRKKFLNDFCYINYILNKKENSSFESEILGYGEIWSARLMSSFLNELGLLSNWLDSRFFLRAERSLKPKIDAYPSRVLLKDILKKNWNKYLIITGFIASDSKGKTVLLGRNGSDYSATQIAALANITEVTIWSDVEGIYTADPKKVENSSLLPLLNFNEAYELARLSNSILHTRTLDPIFFNNINLQLRSSFFPKKGKTKIRRFINLKSNLRIIATQDNVCLVELNLEKKSFFKKCYKNFILYLRKKDLQPLAIGLSKNKKLVQLCYPFELGKLVLRMLENKIKKEKLCLKSNFSLIALIGSRIFQDPFCIHVFYKKLKSEPVEFIYYSNKKISLIAILRKKNILNLIRDLHQSLFYAKNNIKMLNLIKLNIGF